MNPSIDIVKAVDWATLGVVLTIVTAVSSLTWWLSGQFSSVKNLIHARLEAASRIILDKLEYHEKHDDDRFSDMRKQLADIQLRNATKDVLLTGAIARLDKLNGYVK